MRTRLVIALASVSAAMLTAPPASASGHLLTGIAYVDQYTPPGPADRKEVSVDCPGTKVVVGSGFTIYNGNLRVVAESVEVTEHGVTVTAHEDETLSAPDWGLRARATCANRPPGHQILTVPSPTGGGPSIPGVAACPDGKVVTGAGFILPATGGELTLTRLIPSSKTVSALVHEDDTGLAPNWFFRVTAICSYPLQGLRVVTDDRDHDVDYQDEIVECPQPGFALNPSGYFDGGGGDVRFSNFNAVSLPGANFGSPTDFHLAAIGGSVDSDGARLPFEMTGMVTCADATL
ncbi:hypothetical protein EDD29_4969 [Actinocorallia herbida]|uniref:Neocarzinostatin family protein n=1 Tax=Actinocorallia herbida TaxID=58109 RepID=A0A3N1D1F5_9ACTN|nr:hypothetical protein [Actinocorallia herbida]ROO87367.1 hypothetical protein EDD29_4969 [Actinocorallia herbida]